MRRVLVAVGMACAIGLASIVVSTPAAAFLEFLFGSPQAPAAPAPNYYSRPLDVSVRPKRGARGAPRGLAPHAHKRELGRKGAQPAGPKHATREPKGERSSDRPKVSRAHLQRSINPETNPDWFLKDPNIRYGDILVLKTGPVVYQGGASGARAREDFVSLGQSRIISRSHLRDIRMMVSGVWTPPEPGAATPGRRKRSSVR